MLRVISQPNLQLDSVSKSDGMKIRGRWRERQRCFSSLHQLLARSHAGTSRFETIKTGPTSLENVIKFVCVAITIERAV